MDREEIIAAIRRTAEANSGVALGRKRFSDETGIRDSDWYGVHWATWSDAVLEAGYVPNLFNEGYDSDWLIESFIAIIREVGGWPPTGKLRMMCRNRDDLPSKNVFRARLGTKSVMAAKIVAYCQERTGYDDILLICEGIAEPIAADVEDLADTSFGFVYLMKFGKYHKIGRSNSVGRREYELGTKLPEELTTVHTIKTDDPVGIEKYWHSRFADKRREGEWFELNSGDVRAFKRWLRIH
jgi:hypothetical protein